MTVRRENELVSCGARPFKDRVGLRSYCARLAWAALLEIVALAASVQHASASDVSDTDSKVAPILTIAPGNPSDADFCKDGAASNPLLLFDAIERALCSSPTTRSAWASVKAAVAGIGISKSAYLPTLDADVRYAYEHNVTQVSDDPQLQSNYAKAVNQESLSLGWVLYDFGGRSASLRNSQALLLAAQANQDAILQSVFAATAKDYFKAQAANANVLSRLRIEDYARKSLAAATARVSKGVAPVTDQLQANTAFAQAVYERAKAEGDLRTIVGTLAVDMSLSPDEVLNIPELDSGALPDTSFVQAVHVLLEDAQRTHPKIVAAAAQWQVALANVHFARARGLPVVSLVGQSDRSNRPVSASLGQPELPAVSRENYIGIKIEIPLFDGFNRDNQIRQAEARADIEEQGLRDTRQQVAVNVWSGVQTLQTETESLRDTDVVLQSAKQAFDAAQHRYQSGVGNILELLSAQGTMAVSEQQAIQAQFDWRTARLRLAESLGNLGMWAIR